MCYYNGTVDIKPINDYINLFRVYLKVMFINKIHFLFNNHSSRNYYLKKEKHKNYYLHTCCIVLKFDGEKSDICALF